MSRILFLCFIVSALALNSGAAIAGQVPLDEDGFTSYVAKAFEKTHPGASVTVEGPLQLKVKRGREIWSSYLFTIYSYCLRSPDTCAAAVAVHAEQIAAAHKSDTTPIEASALRVIVRQTEYVEQIAKNLAGKGDPIAEPIVGDLWAIAVIDRPETVIILAPKHLDSLHLSADEALARAKENTKAAMTSRIPVPKPGSRTISVLLGDAYQASVLAFPELWAPVAKACGNHLIVAVPGSNTILFSEGEDGEAVKALEAVAKVTMEKEFRPLSAAVYRWTEKGWVAASR